jgi:hypothetical protein
MGIVGPEAEVGSKEAVVDLDRYRARKAVNS